jgi:hypothetical protein
MEWHRRVGHKHTTRIIYLVTFHGASQLDSGAVVFRLFDNMSIGDELRRGEGVGVLVEMCGVGGDGGGHGPGR